MSIEVETDGPYVVHGLPAHRQRIVRSERGEALSWETTGDLEVDQTYYLCRCGQSQDKPFCDGTHERLGFDGAEAAPTTSYDERASVMPGEGIVVRDDRGICEHASFCATRAGNVWSMVEDGGTADDEVRSRLQGMVENCPSGALTYRTEQSGPDSEPDLGAAIGIVDDGPIFVSGGVPLTRADGEPFESRARMTLCRCGKSGLKPLCDGSHAKVGFTDS